MFHAVFFTTLFAVCSLFCHSPDRRSRPAHTPSPANVAGDFCFVSAQFPTDPSSRNIQDLTNQVFDAIADVLHSKGFNLKQIVKTVVYLTDMHDFSEMDEVYNQRLDYKYPPARDVIQVENLENRRAKIAIACVAHK